MKLIALNKTCSNRLAIVRIAVICLGLNLAFFNSAFAQGDSAKRAVEVVEGFLDEDGDGFNDLLPDKDGDGIPDMIDPDFKGHKAESLYINRYRTNQQNSLEIQELLRMMHHGEPGQYGPNDSTGHGGHHDGGGHSGGGHGGDGMGGGKILPKQGNQIGITQPKGMQAIDQKKDLKSGK